MKRLLVTCGTISNGLICIYLEPKRKMGKKMEQEKIFGKIMTENSPSLLWVIDLYSQEAQWTPHRINPKTTMPRYIIENLLKAKYISPKMLKSRQLFKKTNYKVELTSHEYRWQVTSHQPSRLIFFWKPEHCGAVSLKY